MRLYKAPEFFVFTADEENALALSQTIVNDFHVVWIGESASSSGFYMGPFWIYFKAFWLFVGQSDPTVLAFVAGLIGVLSALAIFITAKKLFNLKIAVIAGTLYATLPLVVFFDRRFWLISPVPLVSSLLVLSLYLTRTKPIFWIAVGFLYGMVWHVHLSLAPFILVIIYQLWEQRKALWKLKKIAAAASMAFIFTISPLLVFDYFHNFSNLSTPLRLAQQKEKQPKEVNPLEHISNIFRSYGRIWYLYPNRPVADEVLHACSLYYTMKEQLTPGVTTQRSLPIIWISIFSAFILAAFFFSRSTWKNRNTKIIALSIIVLWAGYVFLPLLSLDYYLLGTFPIFLLIAASLTASKNEIISKVVLLAAITFSLLGIYTILTDTGDYGLTTKINLVKKVMAVVGDEKFEVREHGLCHTSEGWRPIFKKFGRLPERSPSDASMGYLYPNEITKNPVKYTVVMVEKRAPHKYSPSAVVIDEGGFRALVVKR